MPNSACSLFGRRIGISGHPEPSHWTASAYRGSSVRVVMPTAHACAPFVTTEVRMLRPKLVSMTADPDWQGATAAVGMGDGGTGEGAGDPATADASGGTDAGAGDAVGEASEPDGLAGVPLVDVSWASAAAGSIVAPTSRARSSTNARPVPPSARGDRSRRRVEVMPPRRTGVPDVSAARRASWGSAGSCTARSSTIRRSGRIPGARRSRRWRSGPCTLAPHERERGSGQSARGRDTLDRRACHRP
jgi:hypothetical protein